MSEPIDLVLSRLNGVQQAGSGWMAKCPCRDDDQNPSLSVGVGRDGRVLMNCHRGVCSVHEICESMDIKVADLYVEKPKERSKLELTDTWSYHDKDGTLLFQKLRFIDPVGSKTFRQRRPDGAGGWEYSLTNVPKILYRLPEVLAAVEEQKDIWVVEGERDADTVYGTGRVATTMPGGAGKWLKEHTATLKGAKRVVICADNDEVGQQHAWAVAAALGDVGVSTLVLHSPVGKDVTDLIRSGKDITDLKQLPKPGALQLPDDKFSDTVSALIEVAQSEISVEAKLSKARHLLDVTETDTVSDTGRLTPWKEFIEETDDDSYDWLITNLLERGERVIVVAPEGVGKSMLARQVALCCAAGIHPFTLSDIEPITTLYVDLENPERIIRRTSRRILAAAEFRSGRKDGLDAHLFSKPDGLNLLNSKDRIQLEQVLETVQPDLLCLGPLYKSFIDPGGRTSESIAIEVATYLDYVRTVYNTTLWLEHHAPLGSGGSRDLRPFGSAVWSRWPEFGLTLEQDPVSPGEYVVGAFRGARDERAFPKRMKRGDQFPFVVTDWE